MSGVRRGGPGTGGYAPLLMPQIIDPSHPFPHLKNKTLYAAALLREGDKRRLGIVGVPDVVPPILPLPARPGAFVRTEDILAHHLLKIFKIYQIEEQAVVSVTRNADISYDEAMDQEDLDLRAQMTKLLRQRERLAPVRLEMQGEAPALQAMLLRRLRLTAEQSYVCTCPLVLKYAYQLDSLDSALFYPPHAPAYPAWLDREVPMWEQIRQRDVLLFYPYHSMQPFLDLLRQSAADPAVVSIQMTIYRVAGKSAVIKHLCAAAENGKAVTVLVELRARFDEGNNITWARELEEAGCRVIYGPAGYKCHGKICLITRKEKTGLSYVTQIGTGNYNEKTAALYTDFSLLTADRTIAADGVAFFQNMLIGDLRGSYGKLLVAPVSLKQTLLRLIDGEIARGDRGRIILKTNAVTERELIDKLAEASQAGVRVDLIVRGICCLVPGVPGKTDHITVTSIVGEFLEHSRIYCFGEGALRQMYLSSADIMTPKSGAAGGDRLPGGEPGGAGLPLGLSGPASGRQCEGPADAAGRGLCPGGAGRRGAGFRPAVLLDHPPRCGPRSGERAAAGDCRSCSGSGSKKQQEQEPLWGPAPDNWKTDRVTAARPSGGRCWRQWPSRHESSRPALLSYGRWDRRC